MCVCGTFIKSIRREGGDIKEEENKDSYDGDYKERDRNTMRDRDRDRYIRKRKKFLLLS